MSTVENSRLNVGVFVDVANVSRNGGYGMRYDILRAFACRDGAEPVRLNAYVTFDQERATSDAVYRAAQENYYSLLRDFGYKVIQKTIRWYIDEDGTRYGKASTDLDMAVDVLTQAEHLDRVLLVVGDGDFARVAQTVQQHGCRVEVLGFENVSQSLRREADAYIPGVLVPMLLPCTGEREGTVWGDVGSRVRGVCYSHHEKGYGFLRFLKRISPDLWKIDSRQGDSPYATAFFHDSNLPPEIKPGDLPSRNVVLEFDLTLDEAKNRGFIARNLQVAGARRRPVGSRVDLDQPVALPPQPVASTPSANGNGEHPPVTGEWRPGGM